MFKLSSANSVGICLKLFNKNVLDEKVRVFFVQ